MIELAVVILLATILGIAARFLRQPLVLAYLATGALIGYFGLFNLSDRETFQIFSDLGIMFLLFLIGLEIDYRSLRLVGKVSLLVGLGQVVATFLFGWIIAEVFGFALLSSIYIALALTFSSTVIVVKALSERKALGSLYGKISVGVLLVQDAVAILALLVLRGLGSGAESVLGGVALTTVSGSLLFGGVVLLGRTVFPWVYRKISQSGELLFLFSLGWLFFLVSLVDYIGLSVEVGGFLAGLALANSSEHFQIASRMKSLRDFFVVIFFVILGSSLVFANLGGLLWPLVVFSLFVLIGNPLIVMALMGAAGYRKRTSFLTGITIAQISEFSFIFVAVGFTLGHIDAGVVALVTAVGAITITLSTYLLQYADILFHRLRRFLTVFERSGVAVHKEKTRPLKSIILVGGHRMGQSIVRHIPSDDLLVVDFDPDIVQMLKRRGVDVIFGDIADPDIAEHARLTEASLVVSTSPDVNDNKALLEWLGSYGGSRPIVIVRAEDDDEARELYARGADYVLLPYFVSGHYLTRIVNTGNMKQTLKRLRKRDEEILRSGELDSMHKTLMGV